MCAGVAKLFCTVILSMFRHIFSVVGVAPGCLSKHRFITGGALTTTDTIALRGLQFYGFHGALPEVHSFTVTLNLR